MKAPSPLLGFNNNVKHKGRVFHIQTEDSGIKHPHIITHLFADGGRILKTTKTSYAEHIGAESMAETVRAMMQEQHKAMFIALRDGQFDHLFDDAAKARPPAAPPSRPETAAPPKPAPEAPAPIPAEREIAPAPVAAFASPPVEPAAPQRVPSRPTLAGDPAVLLSPSSRAVSATAATQAMPTQDGASPGASPAIELDLDALERAAVEAQTPFFQQIQNLPPPPAAVLGKRPGSSPGVAGGTYRSVTPLQGTPHNVPDGNEIPAPPAEVVKTPAAAAAPSPGAGRYAPSRPAAIFANARPAEGASIFGEELISEKSLDEVILSYLAEDLDSPPQKK